MAITTKKTWPEYFNDVMSGKKTFDLRLADFDVKEGDTLVLQEYDPELKKYTGREISRKISYIGKFNLDSFGQQEILEEKGFYVLSLE